MPKLWLLYSVLTIFAWGAWGFFAKLASRQMNPASVVIFGLLPGILLVLGGFTLPKFRPVWVMPAGIWVLLAGVTGVLGIVTFYIAIAHGSASIVTALTALYPAVTITLSMLILGEKLGVSQAVGIVLALIAGILISR